MNAVARFNPFAALDAQFEEVVRRAFPDEVSAVAVGGVWMPLADVTQEGSDAVIQLDLPGLRMEDVSVEAQDRVVVISGERQRRVLTEGERFLREETRRGRFRRSFKIPSGTDVEAITAVMEGGVLTVRLPGARKDTVSRAIPITGTSAVEDVE